MQTGSPSRKIDGADSAADNRAEQLRDSFALLSPADLASLLGVDERTLAVWRAAHKGPAFVRLGRAIFYRRSDVVAWTDASATDGKTATEAH